MRILPPNGPYGNRIVRLSIGSGSDPFRICCSCGGNVRGGRVYGRWPGLGPDQLYEGRDLALTTDFRSVFAEVAERHMGATRSELLFPGFRQSGGPALGIV